MGNQPTNIIEKLQEKMSSWKNQRGIYALLLFLFALFYYFVLSNNLIPQTYDIKVGSISDKTIRAPGTVEDYRATEKAKDDAVNKVQSVYTHVSTKNSVLIDEIFVKLEQVNDDDVMTVEQKAIVFAKEIPALFNDYFDRFVSSNSSIYNATLLEELLKEVKENEYRIPEDAFFKMSRLSASQLIEMKPVVKEITSRLMGTNLVNPQEARSKVAELVNGSQLSSRNAREMVQELSRFLITPSLFIDLEATKEEREKAREATGPVYIHANDILVREGERITEATYYQLEILGLLKDKVDLKPYAGLTITVLLLLFVIFLYTRHARNMEGHNNIHLLMLLLIHILNIVVLKVVELGQNADFPFIGYLAPVAAGTMLIALLLDVTLAMISVFIFSIVSSILFNVSTDQIFDYRFGFVTAIVCFISIFAIQKASQRSSILKAGILVAIFASLSVLSIVLLEGSYSLRDIILSMSFAFAGGLLTAVLVLGVLPFLEMTFGILSPLKLVELSSPNHPLLRKLLTETPGTYHHSVMVGNLSEAAADAIGANGLLCRVGSFYHDIGKTKRPYYYIENQGNRENPHDSIEPSLSKSIIVAHTSDGVEMLKEHKIPKPIRDIAEQHHGTTLLKFFYHKALKLQEEQRKAGLPESELEPVSEELYRYSGPKAQTKEAAIVGVADSIEAAVRSLRSPTKEQIDGMIDKIVKDRLEDGQFNECDLTLKELQVVTETLKKTLHGIFHARIEYPENLRKNQ